jgi:hypothetical protein
LRALSFAAMAKPSEWTPPTETAEQIKARKYECFIEDHEPKPWTPGQCAGYAGRGLHLMRCKRRDGHGMGGLFCGQHAKSGGY